MTRAPDTLDGTVQLVIGGSGGIGSRVSRDLAASGARVAIAGRRLAELEGLSNEIDGQAFELDATQDDAVYRCLERTASWGARLDGVVNCAGSILLKPAHLTTVAEFQQVMATNLMTAFATVKSAARLLRKTGGSVVLMSSAAAQVGLANHEAIAAAKAGVIGLMRSAAATYAAHGIRFNAVAPGLVETPASSRITENATSRSASEAMHPLGRIGQPNDVSGLICWLLSPASSWVTGQVIGVDGGLATLKTRTRGER